MSETGDAQTTLMVDGTLIDVTAKPSPCWGATPCVSVNDGRLFVRYLAPTARSTVDTFRIHQATAEEQARFDAGDLALPQLCQRLVFDAWGSMPPVTGDTPASTTNSRAASGASCKTLNQDR